MVISARFGRRVPAAPLARRPASPDRLAAQRQRGVSAAVDGARVGVALAGSVRVRSRSTLGGRPGP